MFDIISSAYAMGAPPAGGGEASPISWSTGRVGLIQNNSQGVEGRVYSYELLVKVRPSTSTSIKHVGAGAVN